MRTESHGIADDQVRSAFQRWKNLEEEKARISEDLKELFAEQKAFGHDTKAMRAAFRLKVKMDEARPEDAEHEALVDTYLAALDAPRASRVYARENIEKFDASPRLIKQVVDGMQTETGRKALVTALDIMIEREEAKELEASDGSPSVSSSLTTREAEESVVPHSLETANETPKQVYGDSVGRATARPSQSVDIPAAGDQGHEIDGSNDRCPGEPLSEKATVATQGEAAEPTSDERETDLDEAAERDCAAANAGGDDVDRSAARATTSNTGEGAANTALPANGLKMEYCPPAGVRRSSFAHCFPEPSKDQRAALERDIIDNRVQVPIIRQGNVILDGWARYTIARSLGQSYPVKEYDGGDELLDVIEWQRASRNFTQAQEKKIAADLVKAMPARADDIMAAFGLAEALEAAE